MLEHMAVLLVRQVEETGGLDALRALASGRGKITPAEAAPLVRAEATRRIDEIAQAPLHTPARRGFFAALLHFARHRRG